MSSCGNTGFGPGNIDMNNSGLPTFDVTDMQGCAIPLQYDITGVLGDILMCEVVDEEDGVINRSGIWMSPSMTAKMWRVARIMKKGPACSPTLNEGDYVMYPSDKGIPSMKHGKKLIFLNEARLFCICKPIAPDSDVTQP